MEKKTLTKICSFFLINIKFETFSLNLQKKKNISLNGFLFDEFCGLLIGWDSSCYRERWKIGSWPLRSYLRAGLNLTSFIPSFLDLSSVLDGLLCIQWAAC